MLFITSTSSVRVMRILMERGLSGLKQILFEWNADDADYAD